MAGYDPARSGFASYFMPMLLDTDRNAQFRRAIAQAVATFEREQGRAPVVMDVGCGTGLLTRYALEAGAARVVAIDSNQTMTDIVAHLLGDDPRVTIITGRTDDPGVFPSGLMVDMIVTETFGTLHTSENWTGFLEPVRPHVAVFPGNKVYCVPQKAWTQIRPCLVGHAPSPPLDTLHAYRTRLVEEMGLADHQWHPTNIMGMLMLSTGEPGDPIVVPGDAAHVLRTDSFLGAGPEWGKVDMDSRWADAAWPAAAGLHAPARVLVLEFESQLFGDVMLRNTVAHYNTTLRTYGPSAAVGKHTAWGFFFTSVPGDAPCRVKLGGYAKTIPKVEVKCADYEDAWTVQGICGPPSNPGVVDHLYDNYMTLASALRDTFTMLSLPDIPIPPGTLFTTSAIPAALAADGVAPGRHYVQRANGMDVGNAIRDFLEHRTTLTVLSGLDIGRMGTVPLNVGSIRRGSPSWVPTTRSVPRAVTIDLAAMGEACLAGPSVAIGPEAMLPMLGLAPKRGDIPAPPITDQDGGMRLSLWCLPGVAARPTLPPASPTELTMVVNDTADWRRGRHEFLTTAPGGTIQRRHALTAVVEARAANIGGLAEVPLALAITASGQMRVRAEAKCAAEACKREAKRARLAGKRRKSTKK